MKSKLMLVVGLLASSMAVPVLAWDNPYETGDNDKSNSGYTSSYGNQYQYDLSKPTDRIEYDVDPAAKLRDSIDVNPTRDLERGIGQYGGGVYNR